MDLLEAEPLPPVRVRDVAPRARIVWREKHARLHFASISIRNSCATGCGDVLSNKKIATMQLQRCQSIWSQRLCIAARYLATGTGDWERIWNPVLTEAIGETSQSRFGKLTFWEDFYSRKRGDNGLPQLGANADGSFEWFLDPAEVVDECARELEGCPGDGPILHVGCGTSTLGVDLCRLVSRDVVNVDNSSEAVRAMTEAAAAGLHAIDGAESTWVEHDCAALPDGWCDRFSIVLDKGTLDAFLFAGEGAAQRLCAETDRVLRPGGKLLFITDDPPEQRLEVLHACLPHFQHSFRTLDDIREDWSYYLYTSARRADVPASQGSN